MNLEASLVGLLINDPAAIDSVRIEAEWFEDPTYFKIVKACKDTRAKGSYEDLVTLGQRFPDQVATLVELSKNAPFRVDIIPYATLVQEEFIKRQAQRVGQDLIQTQDIEGVFKASNDINQLLEGSTPQTTKTLLELMNGALERIKDTSMGAPTGNSVLDGVLNGLKGGDLSVLAARPAMGKTAFAIETAVASQSKGRVLFFSLEMPSDQLIKRLWANTREVEMKEVFSSSPDVSKLQKAMIKSEGYRIEVLEDYVYVEDIASKVAKESRKGDVSLVVVDYLQLAKTRQKTNNREREVGEMSWAFKMIAKKNNLPVLLLSQLSRAVESTETKEPDSHHLRDSGSIEQDASVIIMLYRSVVYGIQEDGEYFDLIKVTKNRNGETGRIKGSYFDGRYQSWSGKTFNEGKDPPF